MVWPLVSGIFQFPGPLFADRMEDDAVEGAGRSQHRAGDDDDAIPSAGLFRC